jgi:hypothetical protein
MLDKKCPRCGAKQGQPCKSPGGVEYLGWFHTTRFKVYGREQTDYGYNN